MSNFINIGYKNTIDSIVDSYKNKLNNPYFIFNDKKPTATTYFNQNTKETTIDISTEQIYELIGNESPTRFNKIESAYLYGIERIMTDLNVGDFGLEASDIEGDALVLPNTFIPYPGDYFSIDYLNKNKILFKVISVTTDTIDNGSNFYKITYKLDQHSAVLDDQIVDIFTMVINNVGTNYNVLIRSNDLDLIRDLSTVSARLKTYYKDLFFSNKVQTFTFMYKGDHFYDPYLIEFLIRNEVLSGGEEYMYVSHQIYNCGTFSIDYDRTFFRNIELKNKDIKLRTANALLITDPNSLLSTRLEDYYKIDYNVKYSTYIYEVPILDEILIDKIKNNKYYECSSEDVYNNIIIDYFNGCGKSNILNLIDKIVFCPSMKLFYNLPIIIYIMDQQTKQLLLKPND